MSALVVLLGFYLVGVAYIGATAHGRRIEKALLWPLIGLIILVFFLIGCWDVLAEKRERRKAAHEGRYGAY